jgi:hypothetical protein
MRKMRDLRNGAGPVTDGNLARLGNVEHLSRSVAAPGGTPDDHTTANPPHPVVPRCVFLAATHAQSLPQPSTDHLWWSAHIKRALQTWRRVPSLRRQEQEGVPPKRPPQRNAAPPRTAHGRWGGAAADDTIGSILARRFWQVAVSTGDQALSRVAAPRPSAVCSAARSNFPKRRARRVR